MDSTRKGKELASEGRLRHASHLCNNIVFQFKFSFPYFHMHYFCNLFCIIISSEMMLSSDVCGIKLEINTSYECNF